MKKQIYDYREPFNAPYMIREIAKNVNLPFVVYAQDFTIATVSFGITFGLFVWLFGFNQITLMISIGVPYGIVQLFNKVEPDGKRVDIFIRDYLVYFFSYLVTSKALYHEELEDFKQEKVVYEKLTCEQILLSLNSASST